MLPNMERPFLNSRPLIISKFECWVSPHIIPIPKHSQTSSNSTATKHSRTMKTPIQRSGPFLSRYALCRIPRVSLHGGDIVKARPAGRLCLRPEVDWGNAAAARHCVFECCSNWLIELLLYCRSTAADADVAIWRCWRGQIHRRWCIRLRGGGG